MNRRSAGLWIALGLVALVIALLARPGRTSGIPLDPRSTEPSGARALTELLERFGADVTNDPFGADVDVIVLLVDDLDPDSRSAVESFVRGGGRLVVLDPDSPLGPPATQAPPAQRIERGVCTITELSSPVEVEGVDLRTSITDGASGSCFGEASGAFVVERVVGDGRIVSLGGASIVDNAHLGMADNATVIVRLVLVDDSPRVAVVRDAALPAVGDTTLADLVPSRVGVFGAQFLVATGLWLWFRGRRFGKVVAEPQLVEIPGSLIVRSTAELHRRARGDTWAAQVLRSDFDRRMRREHRIPTELDAATAALLIARQTSVAPEAILDVLIGTTPDGRPQTLVELVAAIDAVSPALFANEPILGPGPTRERSLRS